MTRTKSLVTFVLILFVTSFISVNSIRAEGFNIDLTFGWDLSDSQMAICTQASSYWESVITGYKPGLTGLSSIPIEISSSFHNSVSLYPITDHEYTLTMAGWIRLTDFSVPESDGTLYNRISQYMAIVLGFGMLWEDNGVYISGSEQYIGEAGLAAYKAEFDQPDATYVPVMDSWPWWSEIGEGIPTGITDRYGRDMQYELMTRWMDSPPSSIFVSQTTIHSFEDIGYTVVPEPTSVAMLFGVAFMALLGWRMRKWSS